MTDRIRRGRHGRGDAHQRIEEWLADGATEMLPRDVLVHASLCSDCRLRIAALDLLSAVDLEQAGPPPPLAATDERPGARAGRVAMAASGAVAVSAAALVVGATATGWRPPFVGAGGSPTDRPTQAVLGNTGQPTPSLGTPSLGPTPTTLATEGAATALPSASDQPPFTFPPTALPTIAVPSAVPTQRATFRPGATATPRPTVAPTPVPTPVPTAVPTPTDTPAPTPPDETPPGP
ncbi:MAG TPA: hypothetical protein VF153_07310 [Candidatus Limnocylindria bacterium]